MRTAVIVGPARFNRIVRTVAGVGASTCPFDRSTTVNVMVPAVVPEANANGVAAGGTPFTCPAGIVKLSVLPPFANLTSGSVGPASG